MYQYSDSILFRHVLLRLRCVFDDFLRLLRLFLDSKNYVTYVLPLSRLLKRAQGPLPLASIVWRDA